MNVEAKIDLEAVHRFSKLVRSGRLAHAYLFTGPKGSGKFETAVEVAKLVNCENSEPQKKNEPCGECPSCRKIENGNHPDIHIVAGGENETIKIDEIRRVTNSIQLRAFEAAVKVIIIRRIDLLTLESSNALLKTLEEPSNNSLLMLTTSVKEKVLDTIKSRCHSVYFSSMSAQQLSECLTNEHSMKEREAHFLAYFSQGSLDLALRMNDDETFDRKNELIDNFIFSSSADNFVKSAVADKSKAKELLDVLFGWHRDLILIKSGVQDERLIHLDRINDLRNVSERYTFEELKDITDEVVRTSKLFNDNLNIKIALSLIHEKISRSVNARG